MQKKSLEDFFNGPVATQEEKKSYKKFFEVLDTIKPPKEKETKPKK